MRHLTLGDEPVTMCHMTMSQLPERLRRLRRDAAISQGELAARAAVSRRTIARIEAGWTRVNRSTIRLLAHALGVSEADLSDNENGAAA